MFDLLTLGFFHLLIELSQLTMWEHSRSFVISNRESEG
jgi:hypothetical protein